MTTDEQLLAFGLAALGAFLLVKAYRQNTHTPAKAMPARSGVLGSSVVLDPAAPKTVGDFARYDRTSYTEAPAPVQTMGDFARYDRATYTDYTPIQTAGDFARYDRATYTEVPAVSPAYDETPYSSPL